MNAVAQAAPAIAMLACFACAVGGVMRLRSGDDRRKGWLMLAMALVVLGNVLIWTW